MPGLLTLSQATLTQLGHQTSTAVLFEYNDQGKITAQGMVFQYFPESIADTKAVNYQVRDIPGGSLPLYQWISSGERIISFTAYFSSDVDLAAQSQPIGSGVASAPVTFQNLTSQGLQNRNLDVRSALVALRRYMFPTYLPSGATPGTPLTLAPKTLNLMFTSTGVGLYGGVAGNQSVNDQSVQDGITCVMTQCDITIESLFPSGLIRLASVQLSFAQIPQLAGVVNFPTFTDSSQNAWGDNLVNNGVPNMIAQYPLQINWSTNSIQSAGEGLTAGFNGT